MDPEGTQQSPTSAGVQAVHIQCGCQFVHCCVARTQNAAHAVGLPVCWHCPPAAMWASARRRTRTGSLADSAALPRCAKFTWQQQQQRLQQTHACSVRVAWHVSHSCGHCAARANNTAQLAVLMPLLSPCYHAPVQALSCALCGPVMCCPVPQLPVRIFPPALLIREGSCHVVSCDKPHVSRTALPCPRITHQLLVCVHCLAPLLGAVVQLRQALPGLNSLVMQPSGLQVAQLRLQGTGRGGTGMGVACGCGFGCWATAVRRGRWRHTAWGCCCLHARVSCGDAQLYNHCASNAHAFLTAAD